MFRIVPLEIVGENKVEGIKFAKSENVSGKVKVIAESEFIEPCDMVIKAPGQAKFQNFLSTIDNIKLDDKHIDQDYLTLKKPRMKITPEETKVLQPTLF